MLDDGITEGKYVECSDNILKDLESFQSFLYRHFKDHADYQNMRPVSNQPARFLLRRKRTNLTQLMRLNLTSLNLDQS